MTRQDMRRLLGLVVAGWVAAGLLVLALTSPQTQEWAIGAAVGPLLGGLGWLLGHKGLRE